jgi:hypothetical protein
MVADTLVANFIWTSYFCQSLFELHILLYPPLVTLLFFSFQYHVLRSQLRSSADMICSDGLSRSFLRATVVLFGAYRVGFVRSTDDSRLVVWNKDRFIRGQRPSLQPFLSLLLGTDGVQYLERVDNPMMMV